MSTPNQEYIAHNFAKLKLSTEGYNCTIKLNGGESGSTHYMNIDNDTVKRIEEVMIHPKEYDRMKVLLKATKDILTKCDNSGYVLNAMEQTAIWDSVECDGNCLLEEITELLEGYES